jgi:hypothetical protein
VSLEPLIQPFQIPDFLFRDFAQASRKQKAGTKVLLWEASMAVKDIPLQPIELAEPI